MARNVLVNFQKECDDYLAIISQELREGDFKEALQWFHEMMTVYSEWLTVAKSRGVIITANDPNGQRIVVDTNRTKDLARARINMLSPIIEKSRALFKKYEVHIQE